MSGRNVKTVKTASSTPKMNRTAASAAVGPWVDSLEEALRHEEALRRAQWTTGPQETRPEEGPPGTVAPEEPVFRAHAPSPVPTEILATAPDWFRDLVSVPRTSRYLTVEGCELHYQHWPNPANPRAPGILFVPGAMMSCHAYDFIAPYFLQFGFQCAAVDYSGQGDSGHRESYVVLDDDQDDRPNRQEDEAGSYYVQELEAVLEDLSANCGFPARPFVVGHSGGGWLSLMLAKCHENLGGVVDVDAACFDPAWGLPGFDIKGKRPDFKSYEVALGKFRMAFEGKEHTPDYILKYIAHYSIVPSETFGGPEGCWTYKHHCRGFFNGPDRFWNNARPDGSLVMDGGCLSGLKCRMAYIYGTDSQHPDGLWEGKHPLPECVEYMRMRLAKETPGGELAMPPMIAVPGGQHNFLHDKPEVFFPVLSALLQEWRRAEMASCTQEEDLRRMEAAPKGVSLFAAAVSSVQRGARKLTSKL